MKIENEYTAHLEQHTPMIHFQYDQAGATLRATELKPKLDRYLIEAIFKNDKKLYGKFKIGGPKGQFEALDYKVKIVQTGKKITNEPILKNGKNAPMFFGNMGNDYVPKGLIQYEGADIDFFSSFPELIQFIREHLPAFLAQTNFGMRQSKGYGSFTVKNNLPITQEFYSFSVNTDDPDFLFKTIDLFYKSLRGGINGALLPNGGFAKFFYMKPLIFSYAQSQIKKIQWEKKTIKEKFFSGKLTNHQAKFRDQVKPVEKHEWPLWHTGEKKIVRDLLGLSTEQTWKDYPGSKDGASIVKFNTNEKGETKSENETINRFASPILFKPVWDGRNNKYIVYFKASPIPPEYLNSWFAIEANGTRMDETLPMWSDFKIDQFLQFAFSPGNFESSMNKSGFGPNEKKIAGILQNIYNEIRKNPK